MAYGIVLYISIDVDIPATKPNRIFGNESSLMRVVPPGAIKHQAGLRITLAASVVVTSQRAAAAVAKGVVLLLFNDITGCIRQCSCAAQLVLQKVKRSAVGGLPNLIVDAGTIEIIRCRHATRIRVANYIRAVVDKSSRAGTGRKCDGGALDPSSQSIVFVAHNVAARQRHLRQAVLKIPRILRGTATL